MIMHVVYIAKQCIHSSIASAHCVKISKGQVLIILQIATIHSAAVTVYMYSLNVILTCSIKVSYVAS